jgi:integrase
MATIFKPTRPCLLPANPAIVVRDGKSFIRLLESGKAAFYALTRDGMKYLRPAKKWYAEFRDADGILKRVPLSVNKDSARLMLAEMLRKVEKEKAGGKDTFAPHRKKALTAHLDDWLGVLKARGRDTEYTDLKKARVMAILDGCGFTLCADLSAERLERFLESLRTGSKKLSVQTTNDYLQAISQFCNWLVENERLERNPFVKVKKGNPERDRRHVRRFLDAAEVQALVHATLASDVVRRRLTGEARAILYSVGACTGYRAGELAELTPECFILDGVHPTIELNGEHTKNGKTASQPIPHELAAWLADFLRGKPAAEAVWPGRWSNRAAEMIQADAESAGVALEIDTRDGIQVLDFHSLRGTFATFLDSLDISLKARQELMRHSDPRLTMNRYTRAKLHDLGAAVQNLPRMNPAAHTAEPIALRATGTHGRNPDAVPDAVESGNRRGESGAIEEKGETNGEAEADRSGTKKPLRLQGFEDEQGLSKTDENGEGGILWPPACLPSECVATACIVAEFIQHTSP